jgi:site-specific DNA-methyltransferase (adenine-specific)
MVTRKCRLWTGRAEDPEGSLAKLGSRADMVFFDPPYSFGIDYGRGGKFDRLKAEHYYAWLAVWISSASRVTKRGGVVAVLLPSVHADRGGELMHRLVGDRIARLVCVERFAQYQRDARVTIEDRHLFVHANEDGEFYWDPEALYVESARSSVYNDKRTANGGMRVHGSVIDWPRLCGTHGDRVGWHKAQLNPKNLIGPISAWCPPNGVVYDHFAGSGSTGVACARAGLRFAGSDLNADYVRLARKRIEREYRVNA